MKALYECDYCKTRSTDALKVMGCERYCLKYMKECTIGFGNCLSCVYINKCKRYDAHKKEESK